ncbi:hypothetical protein [Massilia sp. TWP1-3-3]|uniref:hypothetical protein n=1 Tax=Massilia sp. TWP1-3-3 TaxID=2804573 RepID=UPI003CEE7E61
MNISSSVVRLCGAVLLGAAGSACSGVSTQAAAPAPSTALLQQLRAEIGGAACDAAQQCRTVAIGHKACGGPETYLAWSTKGTDGAKLQRLADAYGARRKADNLASGMLSNCSAVMDPGASCSAGRCVSGGNNGAL